MTPLNLRTEYLHQPMGLNVERPRFSWLLPAGRRGVKQTAYQIHVATKVDLLQDGRTVDVWDSGRVASDASVHVAYAGPALSSRTRYFWRVKIWDEAGAESSWSETTWWENGLHAADWKAAWIASPIVGGAKFSPPVPALRRAFDLKSGQVASARLYISAQGIYEAYLNGKRIGEEFFAPGWTDYRKTIQYRVYDVQTLLRPGANALGALLGDGWFCGYTGNTFNRQFYGDRPALLSQLEIRFADGSAQTISTDTSWKTTASPILSSDFFVGEIYDARLELGPWTEPGFDDAKWSPVVVREKPAAQLQFSASPPVRAVKELVPIAEPKPKNPGWNLSGFVFDLGQNMVGTVRLKLRGQRGRTITIRYAEMLNPDGSVYTTNLRSAKSTDFYTLKGNEEEIFQPRFTFHGFRYVAVENIDYVPSIDTVTGIVLHSDTPPTGSFTCSDPLVYQLQHNIEWGQRGNFLEVPTDCPQRDERLGWTGDAQVFVRTAAFNMDVAGFFTKWARDLRDAQWTDGRVGPVVPNMDPNPEADGGPAWADAHIICPWTIYLCYGDERILEEHYDSARKFVQYLEKGSVNHIRSHPDGKLWGGFGDWLALDGSGKTDGITPKDLIGTAFFHYSVTLLARMAHVLKHHEDINYYAHLAEKIKKAFERRFVTDDHLVIGQTQTAYVLALQFGLLSEESRPTAIKLLVNDIKERGNHLATGFVGTSYLPHVLTANGQLDLAYTLLFQKTWPSWLYAVTQGATTIWERWDGWTQDKGFQDAGMNSFNHYAYGAIGEWLYSTVAGLGIDPQHPGYKHSIIHPQPGGGLTSAAARLQTVYGEIVSDWSIADEKFRLKVTVPPNTTATLHLPSRGNEPVLENGRDATQSEGVTASGRHNDIATFQLTSGSFEFTSTLP
jgi:alpha-L-rhamnosidase